MKHTSKTLSLFKRSLCAVLIAALALTLAACGGNPATTSDPATSAVLSDGVTVGEGGTSFTLEVTDVEGNTVTATVNTDEETVGAALQALDIIQGEEGDFGLYVKTVNGITADYDVDGTYWAFYVDGEYATTGVDKTDIDPSAVYTLKVEKG